MRWKVVSLESFDHTQGHMSSRHKEYPTETILRGNLSQELRELDDLAMPGEVYVIKDAVYQTEGNAASYLCFCMCSAPSVLNTHHLQKSRVENEDFGSETEDFGMRGHGNPVRLLQHLVTVCSFLSAVRHDVDSIPSRRSHDVVRDETLFAHVIPMHLARGLVLPTKGTRRSSPEDLRTF